MKRALLLLCIVTLACTLSFVVFAADDNTAASEYIITIPETLILDVSGESNFSIELSESLSNGTVAVTVTGNSYADGYWHLTHTQDKNISLRYTVSDDAQSYGNNDTILSVTNPDTLVYNYNINVLDDPTTSGNYTDTLTFIFDVQIQKVYVDGLGDVAVNNPEADLSYNPDDGSVGGVVPPIEEEPEEIPELPETVIPELIKFNLGKFQQNTTYTPGTYATVPYDTTYTKVKLPVSYQNIVWSKWYVTTDENDNIIDVVPSEIELADIDTKYTEYIIYNFETTKYLTMEGVAGDSVELWAPFMEQDDTLDNVIYLAAYLNKNDGCTTRHIAKWDGTKYVAVDYDANIAAVKEFTTTYTVTNYKQVEITAPSTSTEWVFIPLGEMNAVKGMTWNEWLASDYNTLNNANLVIKDRNFNDVDLSSQIQADGEYGFVAYVVSGVWQFNDEIILNDPRLRWSTINFTSNNQTFTRMMYGYDGAQLFNVQYFNDAAHKNTTAYTYQQETDSGMKIINQWSDDAYKIVDFGEKPQYVSQNFYEWLTENATKSVAISGIYAFPMQNTLLMPTSVIEQKFNFTDDNGAAHSGVYIDETGISIGRQNIFPDYMTNPEMPGWEMTARSIWYIDGVQYVSLEFYEWLTANAIHVQTTIQGKYEFNRELIAVGPPYNMLDVFEENVHFTVDGEQWDKLHLNYSTVHMQQMVYMNASTDECVGAYLRNALDPEATEWEIVWDTSRIIDFGDTPQTISIELAIWLTQNMTKVA